MEVFVHSDLFMCKSPVYMLSLAPMQGSHTFIVANYWQQITRIHYYASLLGEPGIFPLNAYIRVERMAKKLLLGSIATIWLLVIERM